MTDQLDRLAAALGDRYVIEREIGAGGMATVYLAEDLKHERRVALKTLKPELRAVLGRERFLREIRVTAGLNHPHVLPLLDSGEADHVLFYVMPYVEGESLRRKLERETQLPIDEALRLAAQVAGALHHAHQRGVVHRDIKPENILLHEGEAMVADFGIAMALTAAGGDRLTETGFSVGTPEYMSPEQASGGKQLDARSDVYSVGCVLYEMLAGEPPLTGPSAQAVIARHVLDPPGRIRTVRPSVSEELEEVVQRALAKTPADRWQSAEDLVTALEATVTGPGGRTAADSRPVAAGRLRRNLRWLVGTAAVAAVALAAWLLRPSIGQPPIPPVHRQVTFRGDVIEADISPDGQFLGFIAKEADSMRALVQDVATGHAFPITSHPRALCCIHWSPDGTRMLVGFLDRDSLRGLYVFPRFGGTPHRVQEWHLGTWEVRGDRVVSWGADWRHVSFADIAQSGVDTLWLNEKPVEWLMGLAQHPAGDHFALIMYDGARGRSSLWTFVADSAQRFLRMEAGEADTVRQQRLVAEEPVAISMPLWAPGGDALYYLRPNRATFDLVKRGFSPRSGGVTSEARVIVSGMEIPTHEAAPAVFGALSITRDGRRVYFVKGREYSNLRRVEPGPSPDAPPEITPLTSGTRIHDGPAISPDGRRVAYRSVAGRTVNIFVMPVGGGDPSQVTFVDSVATNPAWSPDGKRIAFGVKREGKIRVAVVPVGARTPPRVLASTDLGNSGLVAWAPYDDIMYQIPSAQNWKMVNPETGEERLLLSEEDASLGWPFLPHVSPNRREVAVLWNRVRLQDYGLYLIPLEKGRRIRRLSARGLGPIGWAPDGSSVFAIGEGERVLYRVPIDGGEPTAVARIPFDWPADISAPVGTVSPDGRSFILQEPGRQADVWVIENFDPAVR